MSDLHILTLNWNGKDKLLELANSLIEPIKYIRSNFSKITWYIRDNGSTDGFLAEKAKLDNLGFDYSIFEIGHNRDNFAQGMNFLFEKSGATDEDKILLLNNDVVIKSKNSFDNMLKLMFKTKAAACGTRLLYNNTDLLQHAGVIFGEQYNRLPYHYRHKQKSTNDDLKDREFQAVTAAVCMVESKYFNKVNGFNVDFQWAFDDIDLNLRLRNHGKIVYCGSTEIYHAESASLKKNPVNKLFMPQNVSLFKKLWFGKYEIDHNLYLKNKNYKLIV